MSHAALTQPPVRDRPHTIDRHVDVPTEISCAGASDARHVHVAHWCVCTRSHWKRITRAWKTSTDHRNEGGPKQGQAERLEQQQVEKVDAIGDSLEKAAAADRLGICRPHRQKHDRSKQGIGQDLARNLCACLQHVDTIGAQGRFKCLMEHCPLSQSWSVDSLMSEPPRPAVLYSRQWKHPCREV